MYWTYALFCNIGSFTVMESDTMVPSPPPNHTCRDKKTNTLTHTHTQRQSHRCTYITGFSKWNLGSLSSCQPAYLNFEVILTREFVISEIRINCTKILFELILVSEFMNPEIRITSTFRSFCQAPGCQDFISKNL